MILTYVSNGKRFSYPTEKAVVAEEVASLRKDNNISEAYLDGRRIK